APHSDARARTLEYLRGPDHRSPHTPSNTPSTTAADSPPTSSMSQTAKTAAPPNGPPTPLPNRSSSSDPPPGHAARAPPCCCPSALPDARRTPSTPSNGCPDSPTPCHRRSAASVAPTRLVPV